MMRVSAYFVGIRTCGRVRTTAHAVVEIIVFRQITFK